MIDRLVARYVDVWNEPDPARRRDTVESLWHDDADHWTDTLEPHGRDAIEARVRDAYERWVRDAGNEFRLESEPGSRTMGSFG